MAHGRCCAAYRTGHGSAVSASWPLQDHAVISAGWERGDVVLRACNMRVHAPPWRPLRQIDHMCTIQSCVQPHACQQACDGQAQRPPDKP
eukprot:357999-Chlamydomonas_euryale.AAC.2